MRSLRITMYARKPIILNIAYNGLLQGVLYNCWREQAPQLHDAGFSAGSAIYRLFTFGPLRSKGGPNAKRRTYRLEGPASFEVRTPLEDLLDILAAELAGRGLVRIGTHELPLVNLDACDRLLFPRRALIRAVQPIVATSSRKPIGVPDEEWARRKGYLSPEDDGWAAHVQQNAVGKAAAIGLDCPTELQIIPLSGTSLRKQVTSFKDTRVTGWMGEFALSCDPQLMQLLYSCGLGSKSSDGFGMFDIDDRPL